MKLQMSDEIYRDKEVDLNVMRVRGREASRDGRNSTYRVRAEIQILMVGSNAGADCRGTCDSIVTEVKM